MVGGALVGSADHGERTRPHLRSFLFVSLVLVLYYITCDYYYYYKILIMHRLLVVLLWAMCGSMAATAETTSAVAEQESQESASSSCPWDMPGRYEVGFLEASVPSVEEGSFQAYIRYPVLGPSTMSSASPLVVFFNGFQSNYTWYSRMLDDVASWGFVTVQYQIPMLLSSVSEELRRYYMPLMEWVTNGGMDEALVSTGITVNASEVMSAGHSRGGKVASLVYSGMWEPQLRWSVQSAFLIDPVDSSVFSPISEPDNPSAVESLATSGKNIAVVGASVRSSCNPSQGNYEKFFAAGAPGSWEIVMNETSHSQFSDAGFVMNAVQDTLCGKGSGDRGYIADTMATSMVSWFVNNNENYENREEVVAQYYVGVAVQEKEQKLTFTVKE